MHSILEFARETAHTLAIALRCKLTSRAVHYSRGGPLGGDGPRPAAGPGPAAARPQRGAHPGAARAAAAGAAPPARGREEGRAQQGRAAAGLCECPTALQKTPVCTWYSMYTEPSSRLKPSHTVKYT